MGSKIDGSEHSADGAGQACGDNSDGREGDLEDSSNFSDLGYPAPCIFRIQFGFVIILTVGSTTLF